MEYIVIKLATGQEIIGKVSKAWNRHEVEGSWTIEDPFEIKSQWAPDGQFQMGLIPFMPYADKNVVTVLPEGAVTIITPVDTLVKEYTKQTSGILLP